MVDFVDVWKLVAVVEELIFELAVKLLAVDLKSFLPGLPEELMRNQSIIKARYRTSYFISWFECAEI